MGVARAEPEEERSRGGERCFGSSTGSVSSPSSALTLSARFGSRLLACAVNIFDVPVQFGASRGFSS